MKKLLSALVVVAIMITVQSLALAAVLIDDSQMVSPFEVDLGGKFILDIRHDAVVVEDGSEFEGQVRIPLDMLLTTSQLPADKGTDILVVSQDGSAGEIAVLVLNKLGYTKVQNLDGGMSAWKMMGFPVVPTTVTSNAPVAGGC